MPKNREFPRPRFLFCLSPLWRVPPRFVPSSEDSSTNGFRRFGVSARQLIRTYVSTYAGKMFVKVAPPGNIGEIYEYDNLSLSRFDTALDRIETTAEVLTLPLRNPRH